jgi:ABC-type lipoprotein export system ATPase subunit
MITFENVTKEYQLDSQTSIAPVKDVNLKIADGEFIIIIGRSGSGKTTLLNLTAGLVKPTSGRILINDLNVGAMGEKESSTLRSQKLGFVFQFPSLLPALTVFDNVAFPAVFNRQLSRAQAGQRAAELLKTLGLSSKAEVFPRQLSAGEQKRAVIARSLMNSPGTILADEPTSDLDEQTEQEVMGLMREINRSGVTFMMVTHALQLVPYATRAFNMEGGQLHQVSHSKVPA